MGVGSCRRTVGVMSTLKEPSGPYSDTAERVTPVLDFPSPYTILRSTQFLELLAQTVEGGAEGDSVRLPTELKGGEWTTSEGACIGKIDVDTWFATQQQGAAR